MKLQALKIETEVDGNGRVALHVPFPGGTRVTVMVVALGATRYP